MLLYAFLPTAILIAIISLVFVINHFKREDKKKPFEEVFVEILFSLLLMQVIKFPIYLLTMCLGIIILEVIQPYLINIDTNTLYIGGFVYSIFILPSLNFIISHNIVKIIKKCFKKQEVDK